MPAPTDDALAASSPPDVAAVPQTQAKRGFGLETQVEVTDAVGAYVRAAGTTARTRRLCSPDRPLVRARHSRERHRLEPAGKTSSPRRLRARLSRQHRDYPRCGGLGFFLGDGQLTTARADPRDLLQPRRDAASSPSPSAISNRQSGIQPRPGTARSGDSGCMPSSERLLAPPRRSCARSARRHAGRAADGRPLTANPAPASLEAGPLGTVYATGALSGLALARQARTRRSR